LIASRCSTAFQLSLAKAETEKMRRCAAAALFSLLQVAADAAPHAPSITNPAPLEANPATLTPPPPEKVFLLVDPSVVAQRPAGVDAIPGPVTKDPHNPLLREDRIWDVRWDNTYITARYDHERNRTRLWWNSQLTCKGDGTTVISPKDQCGHPTWHSTKAFDGYWPQQGALKGGLLYAESDIDGLEFAKPDLGIIPGMAWDVAKKENAIVSNTSNILLQAEADPNRGVIYDAHEANASRRYKAFGSFWNDEKQHPGDCQRPKEAKDGDVWPSCTNIGVAYSSDGIHFDHAQDESKNKPGNQPGTRDIGQDDGALDLAVWEEDLQEYWGLVRIDVEGFSMGGCAETSFAPFCTQKSNICQDRLGTNIGKAEKERRFSTGTRTTLALTRTVQS
jgi:hypothetical protein